MPEFTGAQITGMVLGFLLTVFGIVAVIAGAISDTVVARYKAQAPPPPPPPPPNVDDAYKSNTKALWGDDDDEEVRRG